MIFRSLPVSAFVSFLAGIVFTHAAFAQKNDKTIARVLQQTITASQLEPDDKMKQQAKAQLQKDYSKWLTEFRYVKLASMVWEPLQQQYMKEKGLSVSSGEVTTFFEYAKKARELQKTQFQQALQKVNSDLAGGKLTSEQKSEAEAIKKNIQNGLEQLQKPLPEPSPQEKEFASRTIQVWKFDQSLFKQYGGTVVMKQANPLEPIAAYKKFLQNHEKTKTFEITDADYKKNFWKMFDIPKQAVIVPPDKVDYSKPWWVLMVEAAQTQLKK